MKLYNYLNESRTSSITEEQFETLLEKNCNDILNKYKQGQDIILRGLKSNIEYGYVDPTSSTRTSRYATNNFYTILLDELLLSWKNYPLRSKSIICSNSDEKTYGYGKTYVVFPYNGSKIGVCPEDDIWYSFTDFFSDSLNILNRFFEYVAQSKNIKYGNDKNGLLKILSLLDEMKKNDESSSSITFAAYFYGPFLKSKHKSFLSFLDEQMNPSKNGFKHYTTNNYKLKSDSNEIWIEGECLLLKEDTWDDIKGNYL